MIKSAAEPEDEESAASEFADHKPWVWRTPKRKKKSDVPESYQFLSYPNWNILSTALAEALRTTGFADAPISLMDIATVKWRGSASPQDDWYIFQGMG